MPFEKILTRTTPIFSSYQWLNEPTETRTKPRDKSDEARTRTFSKWASEMRDLSLLFVNFIVENICSHVYVLPNNDAISFALLVKLG